MGGGSNCTHCKVGLQSLQINFTAAQVQLPIPGGVQLHSLQSWTAVTADQLHCSPSSTGGGSDCTHCKVGLQSLQINFTAATKFNWGGGGGSDCTHCKVETAVTADQLHCSPSSTGGVPTALTADQVGLQVNCRLPTSRGGSDSTQVQSWTAVTGVQLHCSPSSTAKSGGGLTAVIADQLHCSPSSTTNSGGVLTALTAKLDCSHCRSTSLQPKFNWGGFQLHSLQSWTAVTADQLHCSPSSTTNSGGVLTALTAKLDCSHCRSTSLQPKFNWGGVPTALTAKLDCSHCRSTSTAAQVQLGGGWGVWLHSLQSWTAVTADQLHCSPSSTGGGSDCTHCRSSWTAGQVHYQIPGGGLTAAHCKVGLQSLQINSLQPKFNCKVGLQSLQINFTAAQVQLPILGGVLTALTVKLDCSDCRSNFTAAQVQLGGSDCTHCKVGLQSLQINFTAAQVQQFWGVWLHSLHCSYCRSTSLQLKFNWGGSDCTAKFTALSRSTSLQPKFNWGGVWLHSLQSWTAVTADQLHCSASSTTNSGGGGLTALTAKLDCSWLQINFTAAQVQLGGFWLHSLQSWTAVTADQLHCSPSSTTNSWGVQLHSLQSWTAVTADQLHCSASSTTNSGGGGLTALTAKLDCSYCRSTSLQPKFNWGGVQLHSLQSWTAVTADQLHCSPSSTTNSRGGDFTCTLCPAPWNLCDPQSFRAEARVGH